MHELGVVFHIIREIDKFSKENNVKRVTSVTLRLGEVSMIVPEYFEDCWKWAVDNRSESMHGCAIKFEMVPAITVCEDCGCQYDTKQFMKICPQCKSEHTHLLQGNELIIKDITVEDQ